ncbi:MAG: hypothetical protein LBF40_08230 [Deltaproteobacteria bacterium]|jgi:predicted Zn finger-like uncharacterized protein|nr:hypothetical protein [Deltaproteobacteria bacterium]
MAKFYRLIILLQIIFLCSFADLSYAYDMERIIRAGEKGFVLTVFTLIIVYGIIFIIKLISKLYDAGKNMGNEIVTKYPPKKLLEKLADKTNIGKIDVSCPYCDTVMQIKSSELGSSVKCTNCRRNFSAAVSTSKL